MDKTKDLGNETKSPCLKDRDDGTKAKNQQIQPWYKAKLFLILAPLALLAVALGMTPVVGLGIDWRKADYGCDPNGNMFIGDTYSPWDIKFALSVSLGWGPINYSTAKAIDVLWDLVVDRGCQALGAAAVYYVFRKTILPRVEQPPTSFDSVLAMEYHTTSWRGLITYAKGTAPWFSWRKAAPRRLATSTLLAASTIYVLSLPTWLSATTAYQPISNPVVPYNNSFVPISRLKHCDYFVEDGDRVGLGSQACLSIYSANCVTIKFCKSLTLLVYLTYKVCANYF